MNHCKTEKIKDEGHEIKVSKQGSTRIRNGTNAWGAEKLCKVSDCSRGWARHGKSGLRFPGAVNRAALNRDSTEPTDTYTLMENLREAKQMQTPLYGIGMAGPRWQLAPQDDGEDDDAMPTLETDDDVTSDETDDDGFGDGPMDDAPPDTATYTQADASLPHSDGADMPDLISSEDDAASNQDDEGDEVPAAVNQRKSPTGQQDNKYAHLVCDNAAALMAFSPKTLSDVDNLLLDLPTDPTAVQSKGKQEIGAEAKGSATDATPTPTTTTATPTAQDPWEEVYVEGKEPPIPRSAIVSRQRPASRLQIELPIQLRNNVMFIFAFDTHP
eukprot:g36171.t1